VSQNLPFKDKRSIYTVVSMRKKSVTSTMIMFLVAMPRVDFEPTQTHFCAGINEASVNILNTSSLPQYGVSILWDTEVT